ncbi:T9SS type A sorting domain-containing protein [Bacteroidales bacterium OttesenSCG-928-C19]|nr:T9SS type A sorting domain-containing protein [Bacteroidales bacterium OttesenSCG-928-C19]
MKKYTFLALLFLFITGSVFSQSFEFHKANGGGKISDTLHIDANEEELDPAGIFERHIDIKNLTNNSLDAKIVGNKLNEFGECYINYCYGFCPEVGTPTDAFSVPAGGFFTDFFIDLYIPEVGDYYFDLRVFNSANSADETSIVIAVKKTSTNAIKSPEKSAMKVDIYPNPASDNVKVKYDLGGAFSSNSQLIIRNLVGAVVKTMPLNATEKETTISVSDLSSGIYFYSLSIDGVIQNTKKLIIRK